MHFFAFYSIDEQQGPEDFVNYLKEVNRLALDRKLNISQQFSIPKELFYNCNAKKKHEIENSLQEIHFLIEQLNPTHIIDFGSGLGYLSCVVAALFGIPVIGLELSTTNCTTSINRAKKIGAILKDPQFRENLANCFSCFNFTIESDITHDNFRENLENIVFANETKLKNCRLLVIGLHTCGDLAVSMIRLFCEMPEISGLINLGCCYNQISVPVQLEEDLLDEKYRFKSNLKKITFPLSGELFKGFDNLVYNRRFMLLASHSNDKDILFLDQSLESTRSAYMRAKIEVIAESIPVKHFINLDFFFYRFF